jgi:hypothetical protein
MKPTDHDMVMVKLALDSVDLVIVRSLIQQAVERRPDADWQRPDLLTRARDLLTEFYQENEHGRELGKAQPQTGVNLTTGVLPHARPQAKPLRVSGARSDHLSRITPCRRSLSGRTK